MIISSEVFCEVAAGSFLGGWRVFKRKKEKKEEKEKEKEKEKKEEKEKEKERRF